jgi:hypothetical protein
MFSGSGGDFSAFENQMFVLHRSVRCRQCREEHAKCDRKMPCSRCVSRGRGHLCVYDDLPFQKYQRKEESEESTGVHTTKEKKTEGSSPGFPVGELDCGEYGPSDPMKMEEDSVAEIGDHLEIVKEYSRLLRECVEGWMHHHTGTDSDEATRSHIVGAIDSALEMQARRTMVELRDEERSDAWTHPTMFMRLPTADELMHRDVLDRPSFRIVGCNVSFTNIFGLPEEEVVKLHPLGFVDQKDLIRIVHGVYVSLLAHHDPAIDSDQKRYPRIEIKFRDVVAVSTGGQMREQDCCVYIYRSTLCFPTLAVLEVLEPGSVTSEESFKS